MSPKEGLRTVEAEESAARCYVAPEELPPDLLDTLFLSVRRGRLNVKLLFRNDRLFLAVTAHDEKTLKDWMKGLEGRSVQVLCG